MNQKVCDTQTKMTDNWFDYGKKKGYVFKYWAIWTDKGLCRRDRLNLDSEIYHSQEVVLSKVV